MDLIGIKNVTTQDVVENALVNLGVSYRRFISKDKCGFPTYSLVGDSVVLNRKGMYHVTATAIVAGQVAGDVTLQLEENGEVITGAIATETITTPDTELRTLVIDYIILVDKDVILSCPTTTAKSISIRNVGVDATISNLVVNIVKVV